MTVLQPIHSAEKYVQVQQEPGDRRLRTGVVLHIAFRCMKVLPDIGCGVRPKHILRSCFVYEIRQNEYAIEQDLTHI